MKMKKIVAATMLATFGATLVAPSVLAADTTTEGKIKFQAPTIPPAFDEIVLPNTNPAITVKPDAGESSTASVGTSMNLTVPNFDFGTVDISIEDETYYPRPSHYTGTEAPNKPYKVPSMVVVRDLRGLANGAWDLKVSATDFSTATSKTLAGTTLKFVKPRLFNSEKALDEEISAPSTDFIFTASGITVGKTATDLLSAKNGAGKAQTVYMMDEARTYSPDPTDLEAYNETKVKGVELSVPKTASKVIGEAYTSTITWALTNTP